MTQREPSFDTGWSMDVNGDDVSLFYTFDCPSNGNLARLVVARSHGYDRAIVRQHEGTTAFRCYLASFKLSNSTLIRKCTVRLDEEQFDDLVDAMQDPKLRDAFVFYWTMKSNCAVEDNDEG